MIVNALCVGWGDLGRGGNRWFAFDKATGATVWVSSPQKRHYDTNMSPGIITTVNGMKLLIVGGTDGTFHALKVNTGEQVWEFEVSKRAILTGAVLNGTTAYITHSEENLDTSRDGHAGGARRRQRAARWCATRTRSGSTTASRAASPRLSPTASGSTSWTTARFWGRSI